MERHGFGENVTRRRTAIHNCISKKNMKISRRLIAAIGFNEPLEFSTPPRARPIRRNNNAAAPTLTRTIVFAGFLECSKRQRWSPHRRCRLNYMHATRTRDGRHHSLVVAFSLIVLTKHEAGPSYYACCSLSLIFCCYRRNTRWNWPLPSLIKTKLIKQPPQRREHQNMGKQVAGSNRSQICFQTIPRTLYAAYL